MGEAPPAGQDSGSRADPMKLSPSLGQRRLQALARSFLAATAGACLAVALLLATMAQDEGARWLLAALFVVVGASALAVRGVPRPWVTLGMTLVQMSLVSAIAAASALLQWGLLTPGHAIVGLLVCVTAASGGRTAGTVLALWSLALTGVLLLAGTLPVATQAPLPVPLPGPWFAAGVQLIVVASGLIAGLLISRLLNLGMQAADERERRFRRLLALAVDGYWEIDDNYRLTATSDRSGEHGQFVAGAECGQVPWEMPHWHSDADTLDTLRADLEARQPFHELRLGWTLGNGRRLSLLVSGEPRFDSRGIFTGYWGVARNVTAEQQAQSALVATETRYRELFTRIPTPLLLHRNGQVFDANAAALTLFGQPDMAAMAALDLLEIFEPGDSRERAARRLEMLHGQPAGTALPVADFRLALPGRRLSVRATSVRVDAEGGPASLAIFVDDTERLAAEEAVRSSEAMLSTLVATSPDLITLTDMATGRYAMVNRTFERISGWTAEEAVGRTSVELGVWSDADARADLVQRLRQSGTVTDVALNFVSKWGRSFSMVVSATRFVMDRREYMVINARDVTEKERERLEREAILLNASIGIAVTRQRRFMLANRHFERMFGWGEGELAGQPTATVWGNPADYAEAGVTMGEKLARGEAVEIERTAQRKDGSQFTARIRGRSIDPRMPLDGGFVWIVEDVTERREFEQTLARARDEAEAANRAKSAFLANTSHELRTPLNGLIGLSRLARDENLEPERLRQYLEQIELSAQSLAGIISDILDLSRIEAGKLPIEDAVFDLRTELLTLQRTYTVLAELRGLRLNMDIAPELAVSVRGDALRVRQIISNFLVNALKFTESGAVYVRARRLRGGQAEQAGLVRLEVQDTGPGISEATLARLFKPFTQADDSTTRRYGGTGLGLSICHELAALMGGSVGAHSREGHGSTFWAELPLPLVDASAWAADAAAAEPATEPATGPVTQTQVLSSRPVPLVEQPAAQGLSAPISGEHAPLPQPRQPEPQHAAAEPAHDTQPAALVEDGRSLDGARVLMAEDNAVNMLIAVAMLERWGVSVTQAMDGRAAVAAVQHAAAEGAPFDAVLMDVQMPVMSGHEATRAVREFEAASGTAAVPIIALTAAALVSEREEALASGMNDFLTKPIDAEKLRSTLQRWCRDGARSL